MSANNTNTIFLDDVSIEVPKEAHAVKVSDRRGATKDAVLIQVTPRISVFEKTGGVLLDKQSISYEALEHLLHNADLVKTAIKDTKVRLALKTLGVSSKEELLNMLK